MRYNIPMIIRQGPELGLGSASLGFPQSALFGKPFTSRTYAKPTSSPTNRRANSFAISTYKGVHSKYFEVAQNHTYSQRMERGPNCVISPTLNQLPFIPYSLALNPVNRGVPSSAVEGWFLASSQSSYVRS
jgi:hypothetical protein